MLFKNIETSTNACFNVRLLSMSCVCFGTFSIQAPAIQLAEHAQALLADDAALGVQRKDPVLNRLASKGTKRAVPWSTSLCLSIHSVAKNDFAVALHMNLMPYQGSHRLRCLRSRSNASASAGGHGQSWIMSFSSNAFSNEICGSHG